MILKNWSGDEHCILVFMVIFRMRAQAFCLYCLEKNYWGADTDATFNSIWPYYNNP